VAQSEILLVEDDPAHAELIRRAFEDRAPETRLVLARTLGEAREHLARPDVLPSLIIADWRLPDGEGMELLTIEEGASRPVVVMTSFGNERIAVEAMKAGAIDYVVKSEAAFADMPHVAERAIRDFDARVERASIAFALKESQERLRTVVDHAPVLLFSTDQQGVLTLAEGMALELLRLKATDLVGRPVLGLWGEVPEVVHGIHNALSGQWVRSVLHLGGLALEASFLPLRDAQGAVCGVIGVAIDVTGREIAEAELRRAGRELEEAYDATLAGWSRALELRERDTAGHSQRVVDLTLRLASAVGIEDEALVHVRRGALLHDIGKMAVPDQILLKPEALTRDEWVIMRQHPIYGYEMLKSIPYLRPALEIPYAHHERWDGEGYPHGLRGEAIPLAARVFAVVDVWDALTSDRVYRPAWPEADACEYLHDQRGKHFDPGIVPLFLAMVDGRKSRR
jgi:putative nucleotidyltransferase with HDIG domain/PAS domain S-box-containing protein